MTTRTEAIVIGSSIAGMWTARVLADHFDRVRVIERDQLPDAPESRSGVPQDKHVHVLLARGLQIAQQLFPGIADELSTAGAIHVNLSRDSRTKIRGRWLQRFTGPFETYACSRILFESIIRKRLHQIPNIRFQERTHVAGLVRDGARISGVQMQRKQDAEDEIHLADFVVDASGRTSKTPEWLQELGFGAPEETVIDAQVGYAGRRYRKPDNFSEDWHIMLVGAEPPTKSRQGVIYEEEDGVWMVMLAGMMGDYPPTHDDDAFLAFAQDLEPDFHAAIVHAEPLTSIIGYRRTENRLRHYDKLTEWPARFVVLGDAAYAFNPIYGQGMTVAALSALTLGEQIAQSPDLDAVAQRFQQLLPTIVEPALLLATGADMEWIGHDHQRPFAERARQWYLSRLLDAMPAEREAHLAFSSVQHLMAPPTALARPGVVARVLGRWVGRTVRR